MKFKKEFLREEVLGNRLVVVHEEIVDTRRWSIDYYMVFKHEEKLYEVSFSRGATEQQDESPFEYDPDEIECAEVKAEQTLVTIYVPV